MIECKRRPVTTEQKPEKAQSSIAPKFPSDPLSISLRELRESAETLDPRLFDRRFDVFHETARPFVAARMREFTAIIGKPESFEDLAQDFFLKISNPQKVLSYDANRPASAWIAKVAKNLVVDFSRSKFGRDKSLLFGSLASQTETETSGFEALIADHNVEEPLKRVIDEEFSARLRHVVEESVNSLSREDQHTWNLLRADHTYKETAEQLGIPEGTAKSRMSRVRRVIGAKLTEAGLAPGLREED